MFATVTKNQLASISRRRDRSQEGLLFLRQQPANTLIVKILPGLIEGVAKREFAAMFMVKVERLGLGFRVCELGPTAFEGLESPKEGDCSWIPYIRYPSVAHPARWQLWTEPQSHSSPDP